MPNSILSSFAEIPTLIYGALIALSGVFAGNWFLGRRQDAQFAEERKREARKQTADADAKSLDRTMALRKDVFLPAVVTLTEVQAFLASLADLKELDPKPMSDFSAAAAKLSIVAEAPTTELVQEVNSALGAAFLELYSALTPVMMAKSDMELHRGYRVHAQAESKLVQGEIDKHLRTASTERLVFDSLQRNKASYDAQVQQYWSEENAALELHAFHIIAYTKLLIEKIPFLDDQISNLLAALRNDLGQVTGPAFFQGRRQQRERMVAGLQAVVTHQEKLLLELRQKERLE